MLRLMIDTNIQPYRTVTDWPSVNEIAIVVLRPSASQYERLNQARVILTKGTAIIANDL
jgi:hypothetical protein